MAHSLPKLCKINISFAQVERALEKNDNINYTIDFSNKKSLKSHQLFEVHCSQYISFLTVPEDYNIEVFPPFFTVNNVAICYDHPQYFALVPPQVGHTYTTSYNTLHQI